MNPCSRLVLLAALALVAPLSACSSNSTRRVESAQATVNRSAEAEALVRRGDAAAARGDSERAIDFYRQAVVIDRDQYVAWNNLGVELMKLNNYLDAVAAFKVAADLSPRDPRPVANIGLAYQQMGWAQDALENYEEALRRDPHFLDALRGATLAEDTLGVASLESLNRVRQALMIEKDEQWRAFFERRRFRIEAQLNRPGA